MKDLKKEYEQYVGCLEEAYLILENISKELVNIMENNTSYTNEIRSSQSIECCEIWVNDMLCFLELIIEQASCITFSKNTNLKINDKKIDNNILVFSPFVDTDCYVPRDVNLKSFWQKIRNINSH